MIKNRKIVEQIIDDCFVCPHMLHQEDDNDYCGHSHFDGLGCNLEDNKVIENNIPKWCPLKDAK
jgi:hypothetical protein